MRYPFMTMLSASLILAGHCWAGCSCDQPLRPILPRQLADEIEAQQLQQKVDEYEVNMRTFQECLVRCLNELETERNSVLEDWQRLMETENARQEQEKKR